VIQEFHVQNYKKFNDLKVPGLKRLSLIGGMNNVGKTSLLEAMMLLFDRKNPGMLIQPLVWRGLSRLGSPVSPFASSFYRFDTSRPISVEASDGTRSWRTEIALDPRSRYLRVYATPEPGDSRAAAVKRMEEDPGQSVLKVHYFQDGEDLGEAELVGRRGQLDLDMEHVRKPLEPYAWAYLAPSLLPGTQKMAEIYSALELQGEAELVIEILRVIEPKLTSLTTVAAEGMASLFVEVGLGRKVPVPLLGDGTNRLLSLLLGLAQARHGILFVDEFDSGLHYSVLRGLWKKLEVAATHFDCQVIATTHSYGLLQAAVDGFGADADPEFTYLRLQDSSGEIIATRYAFQELSTAIREGWEVR
jgi:hypothetical protein